jgi:hypothetical protein
MWMCILVPFLLLVLGLTAFDILFQLRLIYLGFFCLQNRLFLVVYLFSKILMSPTLFFDSGSLPHSLK